MTTARRLSSFRARLTLRWTLAAAVLLGAGSVAVYVGARLSLHRWLDENVRTVAATEAASSTDGLGDVHLHESGFAALDAAAFTEKLVQIFDARGELVLQSSSDPNRAPVVPPDAVRDALEGRAPLLWATADGRPVRMAVLRAMRDDRPFAVAVGLFADDVQQGLASLAKLLATVWMFSLAATAIIGYLLADRVLAPVARITNRAAWIARGNFDARLDPPAADDELGRMTQLLNSMLDRLQAAVEANRRFAADAAHELRGPLTAMAGDLDVTLRHTRPAAEYAETLRRVRGRLTALTRLTEDLILLVRAQEGTGTVTLRDVPLSSLVAEAFQRIADTAAARGIVLEATGLERIGVYADPALLSRVIDNVLSNAVHYNRDHGRVVVTASVEEPVGEAWTTPVVSVRVRDTGTGIPPEHQTRVFERFFRTDQSRARRTGGSGLGLAICHEVLAIQGGRIRVVSSSPEGTTMEIAIPGHVRTVVDRLAVPPAPSEARVHSAS